MNIHIDLDNPQLCDGCPLLDTPPLWQGKPTAPPECKMGKIKARWKKAAATEALIPTHGYVVIRLDKCVSENGE